MSLEITLKVEEVEGKKKVDVYKNGQQVNFSDLSISEVTSLEYVVLMSTIARNHK
ncbi:hypothetical protein [Bacillus infantis]|uniref:hypothetical protein n=1 Tax=Bacillus infantis TaxID=324767 RepID=UPI003CED91CF